ncbi:hypothetical protein [Chimaeribacter arupi]|uniref:hypothetical protein n=1 Tax=Chimaeribacter arupi TaxID=2060066 RepID=UPI002945C304|nr:hypothetical protein [Chimaeribacter arupi]MDV5139113.1 hypothetical protein [Chimaeribacter arupi]
MKQRLKFIGLTALGCCFAQSATLTGANAWLEEECAGDNGQLETRQPLPGIFTAGGTQVVLEETTLDDIQRLFGGSVQESGQRRWVCYQDKHENRAYWFISYLPMQQGRVSSLAITPLADHNMCGQPGKPLHVTGVTLPAPGADLTVINHHFQAAIKPGSTCASLFHSREAGQFTVLNSVSYRFVHDHAVGMMFSQVTTN